MLQSMGSQRVRHDLLTEQQQHKKGKKMNKSNSKKIFPHKSLIVYSEKHIERVTMPGKFA